MTPRSTIPSTAPLAPAHVVKAIFHADETNPLQRAYPIEQLDDVPETRAPDKFGVYSLRKGWIETYEERADAEAHASQLNGTVRS